MVELEIGELIYLRVTPLRKVEGAPKKEKLSHRYIRPYPMIARRGKEAYQLELPPELSKVHNVFHLS